MDTRRPVKVGVPGRNWRKTVADDLEKMDWDKAEQISRNIAV